MKKHLYTSLPALLSASLLMLAIGCDAAGPRDADTGASEDVAASVSTLIGEETGGLLDQVEDVFTLADAGEIQAQTAALAGKYADGASPVDRSYDEATGTWTLSFTRERTSADGQRSMTMSRVYQVRFLNADGAPQRFFVTRGDTAHSIDFTIVEGHGTLQTPHLSAERTDIAGHWLATGVDTDVVTVNGTYSRSGAHTLTGRDAVRTLDYDFALEIIDLTGPRGSRRDLSQKISGTLNGTYQGLAAFTRGELYREREINRTISIVIEDGEATITVNGEPFRGDLQTGGVSAR